MRAGDIIVALAGKPVNFRDQIDIIEYVAKLKIGTKVVVTVVRGGVESTKSVTVERLPAEYEGLWRETYERAKRERHAKPPLATPR